MNRCHLDNKVSTELGSDFFRVNNDVNGNPRYVISFLAFSDNYEKAKKIANSIGFRVYRGKQFGGAFVGQSYNLESTAAHIIDSRIA